MSAATASSAFGGVVSRLATATSILRTRRADDERLERHDGLPVDMTERLEASVSRLERVAAKLERTLG